MYQQIREKINEQCPWLREKLALCEKCLGNGMYGEPESEQGATLRAAYPCNFCSTGGITLGRSPELAELLYAIERKIGRVYGFAAQRPDTNGNNGVFFTLEREMKDSQVVANYDLTKSLKENIETNPELRKFLLEVLV